MFKTIARVYKSTFVHHADFTQCHKTNVLEREERISARCRRHYQRRLAKSGLSLQLSPPRLLLTRPHQRRYIHQQTCRRSRTHSCRSPCLCPTWAGRLRRQVYIIRACTVRIVSSMSFQARRGFFPSILCSVIEALIASSPYSSARPHLLHLFLHI